MSPYVLASFNAYRAYAASLRAGGEWAAFKNARPGDLVTEITTLSMRDRDESRFGRLLARRYEPIYTREEWRAMDGEDDEPIPESEVFYVVLPDGTVYRWHNADFIVVFETPWEPR